MFTCSLFQGVGPG